MTVDYHDAERVLTPAAFPHPPDPETIPSVEPTTRRPLPDHGLPVLERARRYLARVPPAIAGEHGDVHTFQVCCRLARGFALDEDQAMAVLQRLECPLPAAVAGIGVARQAPPRPAVRTRAHRRAAVADPL